MITLDNWEEYAILRADGELDAAGQAALEAFLSAHPELADEARLYDAMKMEPDETVVFAGKENLLKPEPRVIRIDARRVVWAVAAGVALLVGATVLLRNGETGTGASGGAVASRVKLNPATSPASALQPAVPVVGKVSGQVVAASTQPSVAKRTASRTHVAHAHVAHAPAIVLPQHANTAETAPADAVTPLSTADSRVLAVDFSDRRVNEGSNAELSATATPASDVQKEARSLLARLTPDSDRLQILDDLRATASERITALRATREKLRNADVTVSVGSRDLFTLHF